MSGQFAIYTCGWGADDRDSETAEIIGHSASGLVRILFPDAAWFAAIEEAAKAFEINVNKIITDYNAATVGLPMTERRATIEEITFS